MSGSSIPGIGLIVKAIKVGSPIGIKSAPNGNPPSSGDDPAAAVIKLQPGEDITKTVFDTGGNLMRNVHACMHACMGMHGDWGSMGVMVLH